MHCSNVKSEQITRNGVVLDDLGEILNETELKEIILKYFPNSREEIGCVYGIFESKKYCIYFKNISYLGIPHPLHKKRIQIPMSFNNLYEKNKVLGIETLLIGVYSYKGNIILVDFQVKKRGKNSSAHVYSNDLRNATINSYFKKTDNMGNVVIAFNPINKSVVEAYLEQKLFNEEVLELPFIQYLDSFFDDIDKKLNGIKCYTEMINNKYNNAEQSEWPGFYMEYRLEKYINTFNMQTVIQFLHNKSKGQIDLDLYFPQNCCYGDLKTHSNSSNEIPGNDLSTISKVISKSNLYYVVCNHDTIKDQDCNYEVTIFWNKLRKKEDTHSYGKKMKNSIIITDYQILDINKYNKKYLKVFNQGVNSNNKPREPKISINKKDINNFLIHSRKYEKK